MRKYIALLTLAAASIGAQQPRGTGLGITGIPAVAFDADEGFGYGANMQINEYGDGTAQPYRFSLQPSLFFTSKGRRDLLLFVDAPHALSGGWRFNGLAGRQQQLATPYYGVGNATVVDDNATKGANAYYYRYGRTFLMATGNFQHDIGIPAVRFLLGAGVQKTTLKSVPYDSGTTLFAKDFGSGPQPEHVTQFGRVGLVIDTRDREIGPHEGNWSEALVQFVGGDEKFTRYTATVRQYVPLGSSVTLAERVLAQNVTGSPSVAQLSYVQGSFRDDEALGGATSIRGVPRNRYIGKGVAFSNTELRWDAAHFGLLGHPTNLVLAGFLDAGRVWTNSIDFSQIASDLHVGYGGGVHLAIGPTFVVTGDVGHSSQSTAAIYLGLGYLF
jgi:hypothetical protein